MNNLYTLTLLFAFQFQIAFSQNCPNIITPGGQAFDVIPLCNGLDSMTKYCFTMQSSTTCPDLNMFNGCESVGLHNQNWFGFVAGSTEASIVMDIFDCIAGTGIQIAIYEVEGELTANCNSTQLPLNVINASSTSSNVLPLCAPPIVGLDIAWNFATTPGVTYLAVVDGWAADLCTLEFIIDAGGQAPSVDNPAAIAFPSNGFNPPIVGEHDTICANTFDAIIVGENSFGASSYIWTLPDGSTTTTKTNELVYDFVEAPLSVLQFCYQGLNACDTSDVIYCDSVILMPTTHPNCVDSISASFEVNNKTDFSIYPNPTSEYFLISSLEQIGQVNIFIYDLKGVLVDHKKTEISNNEHSKIDISTLTPGFYIIDLWQEGTKLGNHKLLVN